MLRTTWLLRIAICSKDSHSVMSTFHKYCFLLVVLFQLVVSSRSVAASASSSLTQLNVHHISFVGLSRTSEAWLRTFLPVVAPSTWNRQQISDAERKLRTTGVFSQVTHQLSGDPSLGYELTFICQEKFTTIPVLRGQFGGGTPLRVLGFYDTHTAGRLLTIGAEARKYGDAPWGGVAYLKNPKWKQGKHRLGAEIWQSNRIREFFDRKDRLTGKLYAQQKRARFEYLQPVHSAAPRWRLGIDLTFVQSQPWRFHKLRYDAQRPNIRSESESELSANFLPTLAYDRLFRDNLNLDGVLAIMRFGAGTRAGRWYPIGEHRIFAYHLIGNKLNLAGHAAIGWRQSDHLSDQYFLGGFDTIRGLPDGALFGNKSIAINMETRYLIKTHKNLWLQPVAFLDWGSASAKFRDIAKVSRSSVGVGMRFAIPQVYRLVLRIDYAFSLDRPGTSGISAGMNQLFQPHRPL